MDGRGGDGAWDFDLGFHGWTRMDGRGFVGKVPGKFK